MYAFLVCCGNWQVVVFSRRDGEALETAQNMYYEQFDGGTRTIWKIRWLPEQQYEQRSDGIRLYLGAE